MRLQIAAMPRDDHEPDGPTPFMLVVDEVTADQADMLTAAGGSIRDGCGARAVLVVEGRIDVRAARDTIRVATVDDIIAAAHPAP